MKTLMAAGFAVAMMATASIAFAQADDHHHQLGQQPGGDRRPSAAPPQRQAEAAPQQQRHVEAPPQQRHVDMQAQQRREEPAPLQRNAEAPRHEGQAPERWQGQDNRHAAQPGYDHREASEHGDAYRERRDDGHRQRPSYDPRGTEVWTARQYHDGDYDRPRGYDQRHWDHGERLPPQYYGRDYWIDDYRAFGLFDPPPNLIWVRVDDDALLIDEDTGEIVQIARDVFY